ncbi:MAG: poly-gamma-glutamate biosynthesis protein PgsC [Deltaproteobacteria bacterium]|nr:poly-gamma-glutamate biosynthesis protein PgsC [Deltaproteobacteria bacterium]
MWEGQPDPGVMTVDNLDFFGRRIHFVNGFAANDPDSTERIWNMALGMFRDVEHRIIIFNLRGDRPDRSKQLAEACVSWEPADYYVLMGTGTYIFAREAGRSGLDARKLYLAENRTEREIFESVVGLSGRSSLVMGMGNIGGRGSASRSISATAARSGVRYDQSAVAFHRDRPGGEPAVFGNLRTGRGGMVVPGYIALGLSYPIDVVLTLAAGFLTYILVHALSNFVIIYGKRRTVLMILVGYLAGILIRSLFAQMHMIEMTTDYIVIGYIIPGLIAIWFDRQGVVETASALVTSAVVVRLILILMVGKDLVL